MTKSSAIDFAASTILAYVKGKDRRLQDGLAQRAAIAAALSRGEEPHHYRVEWLRASTLRVLELLQTLGTEFNAANPEDRCSNFDLVDVLATTIGHIRGKSGS